MAIQTNNIITKTDINNLKEMIDQIYKNRSCEIKDEPDRFGNNKTITFSNETFAKINTYDKIDNNLADMINGILIINSVPNLLYMEQYDEILNDGLINNLLTTLNTTKWKAPNSATKENSGCRGACVGLCSGGCSYSSYTNG